MHVVAAWKKRLSNYSPLALVRQAHELIFKQSYQVDCMTDD